MVNGANRKFVQRKIAGARYVMARAYPAEFQNRHAVPDLQSYDANPYAARYTQIVQKGYSKNDSKGQEVAISGRTDVTALNRKFDEVSAAGGIYSFVSTLRCSTMAQIASMSGTWRMSAAAPIVVRPHRTAGCLSHFVHGDLGSPAETHRGRYTICRVQLARSENLQWKYNV